MKHRTARPRYVAAVGAAAIVGLASTTAATYPPFGNPGRQTAQVNHWGAVVGGDEFNSKTENLHVKWSVYNGPGHHNAGLRRPSAWHLTGHSVYVHGDAHGTTGGMSAKWPGADQKYGRWEVRMRTSTRDPRYHAVLILWPQDGYARGKCDGEVDFSENTHDLNLTHFFLHHGCANTQYTRALTNDTRHWHNYAVEWTRTGITGFIDGRPWFKDSNPADLPPHPMHPTIQLDYFPQDGSGPLRPTDMAVDWIRVYRAAR